MKKKKKNWKNDFLRNNVRNKRKKRKETKMPELRGKLPPGDNLGAFYILFFLFAEM